MQAPTQNIADEAKALGVTIEQEDENTWVAVLPAHPDLPGDTELGFPAPSEAEALDEIRAYRAIEQSPIYKFTYEEARDVYVVRFGDQSKEGKLLAPTYREAQAAYATTINDKAPEPDKPSAPRARKPRTTPREAPKVPSGPEFKPTQLPPPPAAPAAPATDVSKAPDRIDAPTPTFSLNDLADILEDIAKRIRSKGR